jgi:hypothetical protein
VLFWKRTGNFESLFGREMTILNREATGSASLEEKNNKMECSESQQCYF